MKMGALPRKHLAILGGVFLLLLAGRFWLAPYFLMLDGNSGVQGIFGFADAGARVRGYQVLTLLTLAATGVVAWSGFRTRVVPLIASVAAWILAALVLVQLYPEFVQRFQVEPNELDRETPYIEANLEFTRLGFGLGELRKEAFDHTPDASPDWNEAARQFAGLPIWTPDALLTTFHTVDARFPYYDFENVAVDRYPSEGWGDTGGRIRSGNRPWGDRRPELAESSPKDSVSGGDGCGGQRRQQPDAGRPSPHVHIGDPPRVLGGPRRPPGPGPRWHGAIEPG